MNIDTRGFSLGDKVTDPITGFTGVIVGITQWMQGCAVASVQPPMGADGKVPESHGFDVTRIVMAEKAAATIEPQRVTGGPQPTPPKQHA